MNTRALTMGRLMRSCAMFFFFICSTGVAGQGTTRPKQFMRVEADSVASDTCTRVGMGYKESTDERFRRFANEIGAHLAPNGTIVLCESDRSSRQYGSAFAFVVKNDRATLAWGIALGSYLLRSYSDSELRGLIAHEIGHNATGIGSCDHLWRDNYRMCEERIDDFGAELVGSCPMLQMLLAIRREEKDLPRDSERALRKRIEHMYTLCNPEGKVFGEKTQRKRVPNVFRMDGGLPIDRGTRGGK